jgi:hypothetical protein
MAVQVRASFKLTGWNANQLKLRVPQILGTYQTVLDKQLKAEIQSPQFEWIKTGPNGEPWFTKRRNGQTVGSPRDIVDLGGFLRSQRRRFDGRSTITFSWDVPYANLILQGYTTSKGTLVPGRNWIKPALENAPLDAYFAEQWRKLSGISL